VTAATAIISDGHHADARRQRMVNEPLTI
jgi:hypothetical protein